MRTTGREEGWRTEALQDAASPSAIVRMFQKRTLHKQRPSHNQRFLLQRSEHLLPSLAHTHSLPRQTSFAMPITRGLLARIQCRQPQKHTRVIVDQQTRRSFVPISSAVRTVVAPRRTLTSSLRRVASIPECPFQLQQRRDLSFLGTLRAVFKQ